MTVREVASEPASVDPRVARTHAAIGRALASLIEERDLNDVSVQQILDRAGVGRATFYAHFRGKGDALFYTFERLFGWLEMLIESEAREATRLYPVRELVEHARSSIGIIDGLRRAGQLDALWSLLGDHAARVILRRLPGSPQADHRRLRARMLSGALMESLRWWEERRESVTASEVDAAFHDLARSALRGRAVAPRERQHD